MKIGRIVISVMLVALLFCSAILVSYANQDKPKLDNVEDLEKEMIKQRENGNGFTAQEVREIIRESTPEVQQEFMEIAEDEAMDALSQNSLILGYRNSYFIQRYSYISGVMWKI